MRNIQLPDAEIYFDEIKLYVTYIYIKYIANIFHIYKEWRGDWGKAEPLENKKKKKWKTVKNSAENMDNRQIFICNNHRCILILNLNQLQHVKDVTNARTIIFTIARLHCSLNNINLSFRPEFIVGNYNRPWKIFVSHKKFFYN